MTGITVWEIFRLHMAKQTTTWEQNWSMFYLPLVATRETCSHIMSCISGEDNMRKQLFSVYWWVCLIRIKTFAWPEVFCDARQFDTANRKWTSAETDALGQTLYICVVAFPQWCISFTFGMRVKNVYLFVYWKLVILTFEVSFMCLLFSSLRGRLVCLLFKCKAQLLTIPECLSLYYVCLCEHLHVH